MITSGTITLDPASHAAGSASLRARLADLDDRRRAAEQSVHDVLAIWRGDAANLFRERWEEWDRGALAVLDQLDAAVDSLDRVRFDLTGADAEACCGAKRLEDRLG